MNFFADGDVRDHVEDGDGFGCSVLRDNAMLRLVEVVICQHGAGKNRGD